MKKIFVFYVCFCLLFSNSVFSVEKMSVDTSTQKCSGQACLSAKALATVGLSTTQSDEKDTNLEEKSSNTKLTETSQQDEAIKHIIELDDDSDVTKKVGTKDKSTVDKDNPNSEISPPATDDIKVIENEKINDTPSKNVQPRVNPRLSLDEKSTVKNTEVNNIQKTKNIPIMTGTRPVTTKNTAKENISGKSMAANSPISPILITEVQLDTSTSSHEEYIELYNTTNLDINLENYKLTKYTKSKYCTGSDSTLVSSKYFSGTIKAHDFFVITHKDFSYSVWHDLTFSGKNYTIAKNSAITLYDKNDVILDRVGFGSANCFDGHPAQNPGKNESIERNKKDGKYVDTDDNSADFHINKCPFPGNYLPTNLSTTLRINEIYPNPCSKKNDSDCVFEEEFIELYNPDKISLKGWQLTDSSTISGNIDSVDVSTSPFIKLTKEKYKFTLNNSNDIISLMSPDCSIVSQIHYNKSQKGRSLNYNKSSWYNANPTPGTKNEIDPRTIAYPKLLLNEILPNPIGDENTDEFIELHNPNETAVNLKYWTLKDASKTGIYTFAKDVFIAPKSYFAIYRKDFKFALNNSNETVSLIAPNEKTTSTVSYKSAKENVSYNFAQNTNKWRWSKHLTPGYDNIFNNLPTITKFDIDKKVYKNVYTDFSVKAKDVDGEKLKVRWDFGDGHKSYIWKTRHRYEKTGTYKASLRIQDESEEIVKDFIVTVKKYPKYNIKITKISPNPAGKDTGVEYIVLKNNSRKKINLQNWNIATGTSKKKLVNHPINKKLVIKSGQTKIITKKYCALTLPNKTGVIEIRRPNSSVSDKLEYGDKNISIPDNATYEKIDGTWQWLVPKDLKKLKQTQEIINQALHNEQILSQQKLESLVAYNAIYNSDDEANNKTSSNKTTPLDNIVNYINALLNKLILASHTTQKLSAKKSDSQFPVYLPKHQNINLCDKPTIFKSKKLHFCQDKL